MIIKRFFRKKDKEKQKITGWMMELFIDHGIDTSGYISDGQPLMTENCSGSQNPDLPPPVEYYHTATHEPAARSPCPTDTAFIEIGLSPLPAEPEFSESALDPPGKIKEKQKITGWMMELFIEHGIDTSGYISDGQPLMTENCSGSQNPDLPPPVEYYHTATHEPAARSPCPTDTEFIESGLSPLPAEPEFSENAPDLPSTKPERLKPRSSILNCGLDPPYNKDPERMAACKRAFCIRIGPPYSYYRYTSGTDPPVESEVRIRSPAI